MKNNLKKYIFETGHGKGLAKAEIISISSESAILDEVENGFVVENLIPDAPKLLSRMGGIVRICEVLHEGPASMPINFVEWTVSAIKENVRKGGKIRFGLSMHPKAEKVLKKILINSKENLKEALGNVRFVNKDFQNLSSAQAWHENLITESSIELHLFQSPSKWYICKTLAIQNFESYAHRDMKRPAKDITIGMFPPKLAQILINLAVNSSAEPSPDITIFDPFCGSGTVLQEAILMNYSASGSDKDQKMVDDTIANLEWLKKEYEVSDETPNVFQKDACQLKTEDLQGKRFALVSETWLGPLLHKESFKDERAKIQQEVEALYEKFFANLKKILKTPTTIVFTAPFHKFGNERYFLPNLPKILNKYAKIIPLSEHERPSLFYERKEQFVGREIWKIVI